MRYRIQPLVDRVLNLRLAIGQHLDHRLEARGRLALGLLQFRERRRRGVSEIARPPQRKAEGG